MSTDYQIHPKHLQRIHRPQSSDQDSSISDQDEVNNVNSYKVTMNSPRYLDSIDSQIKKPWSPINEKYYEEDSSDEEEDGDNDDDDQDDQRPVIRNFPITPPPSN